MRNIVRKSFITGILASVLGTGASFADVQVKGAVGTEYVSWREYEAGDQLLEERGLRAFAQLALSAPISLQTDVRAVGRIYGGDITYDGQYQDGTPVTSTSEYRGAAGELGLAYKPSTRDLTESSALILNLGVDRWDRNITGPGGYMEQYRMIFARLGIDQDAPEGGWMAKGGILFPLDTQEDVKIWDGIHLEPKGKPYFYFGVGYRLVGRNKSALEWSFDYEGYRFDPSDAAPTDADGDGVDDFYVYQPQSELDRFALSLHWRF